MARMLGDAVLPEQVQSRRRSLRNRVSNLRQPIRDFRQQNVPGPDVLGTVESNLSDLRDRFVSRTTALERVRQRRNGSGGEQQNQNGNGNGSGSGSSGGSSSESSRPTIN